jgi:hypothetical protein
MSLQVAKTWLGIDQMAPAAVFFNDSDVAQVRYRQGTTMNLLASPFAEDLSDVLVYVSAIVRTPFCCRMVY